MSTARDVLALCAAALSAGLILATTAVAEWSYLAWWATP